MEGDNAINRRVDIAVLCHNAQTLVSLVRPIQHLVVAVDRFRRWESSILCITALVVTTFISILLPSFYILLANLIILGAGAGIGLAHLKGNLLLKVLPKPIVTDEQNNYVKSLPDSQKHADVMRQFKEILLHTDEVVLWLSQMLEKVYQLVKWDDFNHSSRCYLISSLLVILFYSLPLRWTVTLFIDGFILYYPLKKFIIEKYFKDQKEETKEAMYEKLPTEDTITLSQVCDPPSDEEDAEEDAYSENSSSEISETDGMEFGGGINDTIDGDNKSGGVNENNGCEQKDKSNVQIPIIADVVGETFINVKEDDNDQFCEYGAGTEIESQNFDIIKKSEVLHARSELKLCSEGTDSTGLDTGSVESSRLSSSPNRPTGVVGRIMEFKRKQQQANTGNCFGCHTNFSTILKRKRNCNFCGHSFCAKCCSFKVPKSTLGATAPGSQTEQVVVCQYCHEHLT